MTDTIIQIDEVVFPCVPWKIEGAFGDRIAPIPGTWTLAPESLWENGIRALICCPNPECKQAALIRYDMGELDNGTLKLRSFSCEKCGRLLNAKLQQWDTRQLFCIAYEIQPGKALDWVDPKADIQLRKEYMHAETRDEAFGFFVGGTGFALTTANKAWRIIEVGHAIGYFGKESDKDQVNLSVD